MSNPWNARARAIAEVEHEPRLSEPEDQGEQDYDAPFRSGVQELFGENATYIWNSNPYRRRLTRRDRQLDEIRRRLAELGISELGYGEYPEQGRDEGYTYVVIFDATPAMTETIRQICQEVFRSYDWDREVDEDDGR